MSNWEDSISSLRDQYSDWRLKFSKYLDMTTKLNKYTYFNKLMSMIWFTQENKGIAYTDRDFNIFLNIPHKDVELKNEKWEFIYYHECLHQLFDTFGVEDTLVKEEGKKFNHTRLNFASDCIINEYLKCRCKLDYPTDFLITPEYIKRTYGIEYVPREDNQYTLYKKLESVEDKLKDDPIVQQNRDVAPEIDADMKGGGGMTKTVKFPTTDEWKRGSKAARKIANDILAKYNAAAKRQANGKMSKEDAIDAIQKALAEIEQMVGKPVDPNTLKEWMNMKVKKSWAFILENEDVKEIDEKYKTFEQGWDYAVNDVIKQAEQLIGKLTNPSGGEGGEGGGEGPQVQSAPENDPTEERPFLPEPNMQGDGGSSSNQNDDDSKQNNNDSDDNSDSDSDEISDSDIDNMDANEAADAAQKAAGKAKETAQKAKQAANDAQDKANKSQDIGDQDAADKAKDAADEAAREARKAQKAADKAKDAAGQGDEEGAQDAAKEANEHAKEAKEQADKASEEAGQKGQDGKKGQDGEQNDNDVDWNDSDRDNENKNKGWGNQITAIKKFADAKIEDLTTEEVKSITRRLATSFDPMIGEFVQKCKDAKEAVSTGMIVQTKMEQRNSSWAEKFSDIIKNTVKQHVRKRSGEWFATFRKANRRQGVVRDNDIVKKGKMRKMRKKDKLTISIAYYVDVSGSMNQNAINNIFNFIYSLEETMEKQYKGNAVVEKCMFDTYAFNKAFKKIEKPEIPTSGGGTDSLLEIVEKIKRLSQEYMINVVITDGDMNIDTNAVMRELNTFAGNIVFITNDHNIEPELKPLLNMGGAGVGNKFELIMVNGNFNISASDFKQI